MNYYWKIYKKKRNTYDDNKYNLNETIFETVQRSFNFTLNCNNGILSQMIPKKIKNNPEISIVIPMFNIENSIHRAILSVQNQKFFNFEIIVINDFSTDNSFKIVNNLSINDYRIKIINNTKNMGISHSICTGALISKGKYIFPLDGDDMFLNADLFNIVFFEIKQKKTNFLKFRGIIVNSIDDFYNKKDLRFLGNSIKENIVVKQPTLANKSYAICLYYPYCIEAGFYKKVINLYGKERLNEHISIIWDCIINYIIHQYAVSCELFLIIGYLHINRISSITHTETYINRIKSKIFYLEAILEYAKISKKNKLLAVQKLIDIIKSKTFHLIIKDNKLRKKLEKISKEIFNDKSISFSYKNKLVMKLNILKLWIKNEKKMNK